MALGMNTRSTCEDSLDFPPLEYKANNDNNDECIYHSEQTIQSPSWKDLLPRLGLFVAIALISLGFTATLANQVLGITLPRTLEDAQMTATQLEKLASSSWQDSLSVAGCFSVLYLWQQAFSVPGSVLLNLLASYLYGIGIATIWTSLLTAGGATLAYALALLVGKPFMHLGWVSKRADSMTRQMKSNKTKAGLFWWLLFIRLFPFSPYWFINMASPLLGVPVLPFFWSTFLGSMPYNFVCAQAGDVLGDLTSTSDILSVSLVLKLLGVSIISLVPVLWGKAIQKAIRRSMGLPPTTEDNNEVEKIEGLELGDAGYTRLPLHDRE